MRWLLKLLKNRTFLICFGVLLLIALIVLLGDLLQLDWIYRLLAVIVVLIVVVAVLMFKSMRANRSADEIEASIKKQAEQQLVSTRPDKQAEIEQLQQQLEEAIEKLKQSKLGRGKRGRAALYALPWYLFIGPPGAGKTTAIANSGLNFPLGSDRVRGVGGTRNCDWFFTDSAILLDTAGRYMTEQEDTEEWLAFLDTLKQHRSEHPINGILVGIALPDLTIATPDEIEWHADNIRRRSDELIKRLGVRFPVYLVFTKSDMLQGFVEFFGEMTRREREQIWGCTLEREQVESDPRAVFEQEFDRLVGALVNRRTARLSRPMKREERKSVYAFPLQLATVKENLALFVKRLFQPNPYQESPIFRGFYFTSGTQEGVPLDRVILAVARQFDLPTTGLHQFETQEEAKSYFIKDLFTDVVVPDQYMVQRTSKARRQGSAQRLGVAVASAVLLALFVVVAVLGLMSSRSSLSQARSAAEQVRPVSWQNRAETRDNLGRMDLLRQEVERLGKTRWYSLLGLGRNGEVRRPARALYLDKDRDFVEVYPFRQVVQRINGAIGQPAFDGAARDSLHGDLKAYLLLSQENRRLRDDANRNFLKRHLTDLATRQLGAGVSTVQRGEIDTHVRNQIDAYVDALREDSAYGFSPEAPLIRRARDRIYEPPSIDGLYRRLLDEGRDALPAHAFTLDKAVPARYRNLFTGGTEVAGFFTKNGLQEFVEKKIEELSKDPSGEDWVMGRTGEDAPAVFGTQEEVEEQLAQRYFRDYANAWRGFLRSVQVRGFDNLRDAGRSMQDLGNEFNSPIAYMLARVTVETRFIEPEQEGGVLDQAAEAALRRFASRFRARGKITLDNGQETHLVDRDFLGLHRLKADLAESGGASADFVDALRILREIGGTLDGLAGDDAQVAQYAARVLSGNGGDLDGHLRTLQRGLAFDADARNHLFANPVGNAWAQVMATTQRYLNERWEEEVYDPFRDRFGERYPFDATSATDAARGDVEQYFASGSGAVDVFIKTHLEPYLIRGNVKQPQRWQGRGVVLSRQTEEAIEKAQAISEISQNGIEFELRSEQPETAGNAPPRDRVYISLHGADLDYDMGAQRTGTFRWPGTTGEALLRLSTQTGTLPEKRYQGEWAIFRLFQEATVGGSTTQYEARWPFSQPGYTITVLYYLRRVNPRVDPLRNPRQFFAFNPPRTLN